MSVAITFGEEEITYDELEARAAAVAVRLEELGVERGDRVALWMGNHPAFAAAMYGTWRAGGVVVPVHSALTKPEAAHILSDSGAKVVFCGPDQEPVAQQIAAKLSSLEHVAGLEAGGAAEVSGAAGGSESARQGGGEAEVPGAAGGFGGAQRPKAAGAPPNTTTTLTHPRAANPADLALIAYTAGTSGVPKGAMLTHAQLRANLDQMRQAPIAVRPDDVVLCVLPLFHIFGLNVVLNLTMDLGARLVLVERFDPAAVVELIRSQGVTVISAAPQVYVVWMGMGDIASDTFSGVRVAVSGAAPLPKEALTGFQERFGITIWEGYGLTETAPALTSTAVGGVAKPGCVGRPLPGVGLRLVDADGDDAQPGDPGEIAVRGPNVFSGYWQRPEETERVLRDGWFYTGDIGVLDDDGDLFIVDRSKDMVIVSGFNVYPREVEDVLRRHPNVGDCAVVGAPDAQTGERVRAIVVPDPPGEAVRADDLMDYCRKSLAPYKVPGELEIVSEIPRNAAGKVLRRELREEPSPAPTAAAED